MPWNMVLGHDRHLPARHGKEHGALRVGVESVEMADVFAEGAHGLTNRFEGHVDQHGLRILLPAYKPGDARRHKKEREENGYPENY